MVQMAVGAWNRTFAAIAIGVAIIVLAWCRGLVFPNR
jgi:hypothetical protein